jgi:hypothetical protein
VSPATASPYVDIYNVTKRGKMREFGMFSQAATAASQAQMGRPGNTPAGTTGAVIVQAQDAADIAGTTGLVIQWTTTPTAPATAMRQWDFNNVVGSGVIFTWPSDGESVIGNSALTRVADIVIWNAGASGGPTCDVYCVVVE